MGARRSTPDSHSDNVRKRVCKACDRCRLKKSKCDGASPCSRCRADNAVCFFGERKKARDKVYPKGYVEMLEHQQAWLVTGLQELYRRTIEGEGWPGDLLKTEPNGHPLTHDLLTRLGALDQTKGEHFEASPDPMQQDLWRNGMQRQESSDGSSEVHSPIARSRFSSAFSNSQQTFPLTPPYSPTRSSYAKPEQPLSPAQVQAQAQAQAQAQNQQYVLSMQGVVNPLALQAPPQWPANNGFNSFDDIDFTADCSNLKFEESMQQSPLFSNQMPLNCVGGDYDDFNQFLNPNHTEITSI